jgi:hypothetical protein
MNAPPRHQAIQVDLKSVVKKYTIFANTYTLFLKLNALLNDIFTLAFFLQQQQYAESL